MTDHVFFPISEVCNGTVSLVFTYNRLAVVMVLTLYEYTIFKINLIIRLYNNMVVTFLI